MRGTKRASALGVGVPPGARSQAAAVAAPSSRAEPRLAAQPLQPRGAARAARRLEKAAKEHASMQVRIVAARAERARDEAERLRIAEAP